MKRSRILMAAGVLVASLSMIATGAPAFASSSATWRAPTHPQTLRAAPALPHQFAAPYIDVTEVHDIAATARESGSRYLTLAFLQTQQPGSCTVYWPKGTETNSAGDPVFEPVSATGHMAEQIAQIRRQGGDVIPSFGGYAADTTNTELADSCTSVPAIAREYERVITTLNVHRLDFDVEADSISNTAGITRRNQAIALVNQWARRTHRDVQIVYTLPSAATGLGATGVAVLKSAVAAHATIWGVNAMTFDYYYGTPQNMLTDAQTAAAGLVTQLKQTVFPHKSTRAIWHRVSLTQMNGYDDYVFGTGNLYEVFTVAQAEQFTAWAQRAGVNMISFWALQRDNGSCAGLTGAALAAAPSNVCSGIAQPTWAFSRAFAAINPGHGWGWGHRH